VVAPTARARSDPGITIGIVYPNFGWIVSPDVAQQTFRVYLPHGPRVTEVWSYCFTYREAPQEVKDAHRQAYIRDMGPAGMFEMDDSINWTSVGLHNRSQLASNVRSDLSMGAGHEYTDASRLPGTLTPGSSDIGHRRFYSRWAADIGQSDQ
jgi:ethylbenzene dioxygenase alpha subunit